MDEPLIHVDQLRFQYAHNPIFADVGFSIYRGDFVGIIGANGTGKSTLLKLILGLMTPAAGTISLLGCDIRQFREWARIGYVPQGQVWTSQSFPATAAEVVQASLYPQLGLLHFAGRKQKRQVRQALALVGLENQANQLIGRLSGGQQQRIQLARVLVNQPDLMLLDEPSTGIDALSAASLFTLLQELNQKNGLTVVMVTHDVERAAPYLNRILCLENGSLIELEQNQLTDELVHRHKHPANPACTACDCP